MDVCPICNRTLNATDRTCECGEVLQPWRTIEYYGTVLRHRGLALMQQGDTLGACLSFFQAMLSNPIDGAVSADTIRSLALLDRFGEAKLLLEAFRTRLGEDLSNSLVKAISQREEARLQRATDVVVALESDPTSETEPAKITRDPLSIPPMPIRSSLLDFVRPKKRGDDLWHRVLQSESHWRGEWAVLADWIETTSADHSDMGLHAYIAGLGYFCEGDDEAACRRFEDAIMANPPFLNPAVYFTYLQIGQAPANSDRWCSLRDWFGDREIQSICKMVTEVLGEPPNATQRQNLDYFTGNVAAASPPPPLPPTTGGKDNSASDLPEDRSQASIPQEQASTEDSGDVRIACPPPPKAAGDHAESEPQPPAETE